MVLAIFRPHQSVEAVLLLMRRRPWQSTEASMTLAADTSEGAVCESPRAAPSLHGSGGARRPSSISLLARQSWVLGANLACAFKKLGHLLVQGAGRDAAQEEHGTEALRKILLCGLFQEHDGFGADVDDHVVEAPLTAEIERDLELLERDMAELKGESLAEGGVLGLLEVLKAPDGGLTRTERVQQSVQPGDLDLPGAARILGDRSMGPGRAKLVPSGRLVPSDSEGLHGEAVVDSARELRSGLWRSFGEKRESRLCRRSCRVLEVEACEAVRNAGQ